MNPCEVIVRQTEPAVVLGYQCGQCRALFFAGDAPATTLERARTLADCCCSGQRMCAACGARIPAPAAALLTVTCGACREASLAAIRAKAAEAERAAYAAARKVAVADYEGPLVYLPGSEVDEAYVTPEDAAGGGMTWAFGVRRQEFGFDADSLLDDAASDLCEDALDQLEPGSRSELQNLLDDWLARHPIESYEPDESVVVLLADPGETTC